ncbi:MAG: uroporphyrinogen decarboxylase, partial [Alphaproteobacteria bacterium]|nr:uroporphyrinogen decarboxylase [Alphaproteobacteria bacterium]
MSIQYLKGQIDAGVDAIQLFESWAGTVASAQFENLIIGPNAKIVQSVKNYAPHIPIIGFPRGVGGKLRAYVEGTGVDAVGLDEMTDPVWADAILPNGFPVQGNLDPLLLEAGGAAMSENVAFILRAFRNRPHIFNLGHGILQTTPIAHVEEVISQVRKA